MIFFNTFLWLQIEIDFNLEFGEVSFEEKFLQDAQKIVAIYRRTVQHINNTIVDHEDTCIQAISALIEMLPAAPNRKKKSSCLPLNKVILFKNVSMNISIG